MRWFAAMLIVLVAMFAAHARGQEANSEYLKQVLRLQYSEFCATVGRPPKALAEAINNAIGQDPATWLPIVAWWNKIAEKYEKARCGDA